MSDTSAPTSPTRCRPLHLDRERLRSVLNAAQFADVLYHEAVVAATPAAARSFQLLALAVDCIYFFPLASAHTLPPTRIPLKRVVAVDVASPTLSGQRGLMLEPSSLLFHIVVREKPPPPSAKSPKPAKARAQSLSEPVVTTEYFVSTFEPDSRVFFYVSQAFETFFQSAVLRPPDTGATEPDASELAELLDGLISDLVAAPTLLEKSQLLHELAVAGTNNRPLQRLVFADRTLFASGDSGLAAFLVHEVLTLLSVRHERDEHVVSDDEDDSSNCSRHYRALNVDALEYIASLLLVLGRMCTGAQLLPERLHFFLEAPVEDLVIALTHRVRRERSSRHDREGDDSACTTARLLVDDVLDAQVALLLELEALQQEANVVDRGHHLSRRASHHVPQLVLRSPSFPLWLRKLFKRICQSVARAPTEVARTRSGSHWSLALWRNVKLFDMLWRAPSAATDVLTLILATRVDYLNMYLRDRRSLEALRSSSAPHVLESAARLERFLDAALEPLRGSE